MAVVRVSFGESRIEERTPISASKLAGNGR
jgi:hypothetical protein